MESIAERMKYLRNSFNLSQKEFSKIIGLGQSRLSEIESGKNKPSFDTLVAISENFSISMDWLISGTGSIMEKHDNPQNETTYSYDEVKLIESFRLLTERQKGRIEQQIDNYIDENKKLSSSISEPKEVKQSVS